MAYEYIKYEKGDGIAKLTLNNPKGMNSVNIPMAREMYEALIDAQYDDAVRVVILTGCGRVYSAGGDIPEFKNQLDNDGGPQFIKELTVIFHACITTVTRMPKPVIGSINGIAAGGGMGFALSPDLAIAGESAKFNMAYTGIAASPDGSTTWFLPRLIGTRRAMELAMLNRVLTAQEALDWGLVNKVVPDAELAEATDAMARCLAEGPTASYASVKKLVNQSMNTTIETQMEDESYHIAASAGREDFREGVEAFLGKRAPKFEGR